MGQLSFFQNSYHSNTVTTKEEIYISEKNNKSKRKGSNNFVKHTSNEANDLFHKTVDTANDVVKSVSGKGGLVGKASDTSSNILKNTSNAGNRAIGKTTDTSSKVLKNTKDKFSRKKD